MDPEKIGVGLAVGISLLSCSPIETFIFPVRLWNEPISVCRPPSSIAKIYLELQVKKTSLTLSNYKHIIFYTFISRIMVVHNVRPYY